MRIVLDNNVFISGIFWQGVPNDIIKLSEKGELEIFATNEILEELFGVLKREKFRFLFEEAKTNTDIVFEKVLEIVKICEPVKEVRIIEKDPSDNKFLACAISCQATFIISGDIHLLEFKEFQEICIISPREFLKKFNKLI
ncbi:MAG: putative toxin-antitoxin system toxin component, PIN family [Minisyncoccales bacterium]